MHGSSSTKANAATIIRASTLRNAAKEFDLPDADVLASVRRGDLPVVFPVAQLGRTKVDLLIERRARMVDADVAMTLALMRRREHEFRVQKDLTQEVSPYHRYIRQSHDAFKDAIEALELELGISRQPVEIPATSLDAAVEFVRVEDWHPHDSLSSLGAGGTARATRFSLLLPDGCYPMLRDTDKGPVLGLVRVEQVWGTGEVALALDDLHILDDDRHLLTPLASPDDERAPHAKKWRVTLQAYERIIAGLCALVPTSDGSPGNVGFMDLARRIGGTWKKGSRVAPGLVPTEDRKPESIAKVLGEAHKNTAMLLGAASARSAGALADNEKSSR